jgi:hypothetical protein
VVIVPELADHADGLLNLADGVVIRKRPRAAHREDRRPSTNREVTKTEVSSGKQRVDNLGG